MALYLNAADPWCDPGGESVLVSWSWENSKAVVRITKNHVEHWTPGTGPAPVTLASLGFLREASFKGSPGLHGETWCQTMNPTLLSSKRTHS